MEKERQTNSKNEPGDAPSVRVIASQASWIVGEADSQLRNLARLPDVVRVVGMPDLHPGKGVPIGAVVATERVLYPHLAGNDIGCGMGLWQTDLPSRKLKLDRWVKKLARLESPWEGNVGHWLANANVPQTPFDSSLGTIGGGNHFAELQVVEAVHDQSLFEALGLRTGRLVLLVHSGSRGFGESVLRQHIDRLGTAAVAADSADARGYLDGHDHAMAWARSNRALIADRFLAALNADGERILDLCHNSITKEELNGRFCWLHRKGAAPSNSGAVVIPGSRGSPSYLVQPIGRQEANGFSVAHGAGRKWARSDARARLERRYSANSLRRTELGGRVICDDKKLLYEEAPQAYKDIDQVVSDLIDAGVVRVICTFRPLITYKTKMV